LGGTVHDLERRRVQQLARDLSPTLREHGQVVVTMTDLADVDRWRRAARLAAHGLGWHVRTGVTVGAAAWAVVDDWPGACEDTVHLVAREILNAPLSSNRRSTP
jgi:hypothetical protein